MATYFSRYPYGSVAQAEVPLWLNFFCAGYSLKNFERTRNGVINRAFAHIALPLPREPGFLVAHEYGESNNNPVGPILSRAALANSGGRSKGGLMNLAARVAQPATFYWERMFATTTYRRFSNIAEMTMVSEGRKRYFFQYLFTPKNAIESQQVEDLIGTFRKSSYPTVASGLPERSYPQQLWALSVSRGAGSSVQGDANLNQNWLGDPLVCVLETVKVEKNDSSDPVVRYLPNGASSLTLLGLQFTEFETGTYVPEVNAVWSKSEISNKYFGPSE